MKYIRIPKEEYDDLHRCLERSNKLAVTNDDKWAKLLEVKDEQLLEAKKELFMIKTPSKYKEGEIIGKYKITKPGNVVSLNRSHDNMCYEYRVLDLIKESKGYLSEEDISIHKECWEFKNKK